MLKSAENSYSASVATAMAHTRNAHMPEKRDFSLPSVSKANPLSRKQVAVLKYIGVNTGEILTGIMLSVYHPMITTMPRSAVMIPQTAGIFFIDNS